MSREDILTLIQALAAELAFDPAVLAGQVEQESGFNPWAIRYEPGFESRYGVAVRTEAEAFVRGKAISLETEIKARCTSWGPMQVMGQVAREMGFAGSYLSQLCDPEIGLRLGCKRLSTLRLRALNDSDDFDNALLRYNGGGDPDYPRKVRQRAEKYKALFV